MCEKQDDLDKWMCDGEVVEKMRGAINHFTFHTIIQIFPSATCIKESDRQRRYMNRIVFVRQKNEGLR